MQLERSKFRETRCCHVPASEGLIRELFFNVSRPGVRPKVKGSGEKKFSEKFSQGINVRGNVLCVTQRAAAISEDGA